MGAFRGDVNPRAVTSRRGAGSRAPAIIHQGANRMRVSAAALETISVEVPEAALEVFEAALGSVCATVGFFRDHAGARWLVEGVKPAGEGDAALTAALALATALTGVEATPRRAAIPADGWLARTRAAFPQQVIG